MLRQIPCSSSLRCSLHGQTCSSSNVESIKQRVWPTRGPSSEIGAMFPQSSAFVLETED